MRTLILLFQKISDNSLIMITFVIELLIGAILIEKIFVRSYDNRHGIKLKDKYGEFIKKYDSDCHIIIRRKDLYPVFCSDGIEKILGIEIERFQNDIGVANCILTDEDYNELKEIYNKWNENTDKQIELDFKNKSGENWYRVSIVRSEDEKYDYISLKDITEFKNKEFELSRKIAESEKESNSKTVFLSRMSHEIRTPMNGIIGMLNLCKEHIENEDVRGYIEKAENLSEYLLSVINDILDISRIEAGKIELEKKEIDLIEFTNKLSDMFKKNIEAKGVKFTINISDIKDRYVVGDELRLSQVMVNFLSNAMKFTKSGEIKFTIKQMQKGSIVSNYVFRVSDTGKGMKSEFVSRIFNPFEQENNHIARNYGGSGLGMAITDQIVTLMGGQIVIDTKEGVGSEFSVFLSLPIAEHKETEAVSTYENIHNDEFTYDGMRILLAEDNDINAEIAIKMLENDGAKVEWAVDGADVVEKFKNSANGYYDIILMDIQMPVMNGWDATKVIRSLERTDSNEIPIFALSADAYVEEQRHSKEIGMNGHFSKPVDFVKMKKEIGIEIRRKKES